MGFRRKFHGKFHGLSSFVASGYVNSLLLKMAQSNHRNSWFTHLRWWFSMVMLVYQRLYVCMFCMTWGLLPTQLEVGCGFIRWTSEILNYLANYLAHAKLQRPMSIIYILYGVLNFHPHPKKVPEFSWTRGWSIECITDSYEPVLLSWSGTIEGCFAAVGLPRISHNRRRGVHAVRLPLRVATSRFISHGVPKVWDQPRRARSSPRWGAVICKKWKVM